MKRLLFVSVLVLGFMVSPCFAIQYCKDFLEDGNPGGWSSSLKTFEDTWVLSPGETVEVDIWLNDVPGDLVTAGFSIIFDPALVNITDVIAYDTDNGGPWDPELISYHEFAPGEWFFVEGSLDCATPDADGDIILGKVTFECQGPGNATVTFLPIPGFDTVVNCLGELVVYDPEILPNTVTITQPGTTTTTTLSPEPTIISVGDNWGIPGSSENSIEISLDNSNGKVRAVQLDVCDVDDYLFCSTCEVAERSSNFTCLVREQDSGCVRAILIDISLDNLIDEGSGPIFVVNCHVSTSAPPGECRELIPENIEVVNENLLGMDVESVPGEFCFLSEGTIIIDGCDTKVTDREIEGGLTMSDLIEECAISDDGKQGKFASCVSKLTNEWKKDGLINGKEKGAIQSCVAQSDT